MSSSEVHGLAVALCGQMHMSMQTDTRFAHKAFFFQCTQAEFPLDANGLNKRHDVYLIASLWVVATQVREGSKENGQSEDNRILKIWY
jgi:hypothetical protein